MNGEIYKIEFINSRPSLNTFELPTKNIAQCMVFLFILSLIMLVISGLITYRKEKIITPVNFSGTI